MITSEQIRAAMGILRWSRRIVAKKTGLHPRTVQIIAEGTGVPNSKGRTLETLKNAFEEEGIIFLNETGKHVGIQYKGRKY